MDKAGSEREVFTFLGVPEEINSESGRHTRPPMMDDDVAPQSSRKPAK